MLLCIWSADRGSGGCSEVFNRSELKVECLSSTHTVQKAGEVYELCVLEKGSVLGTG